MAREADRTESERKRRNRLKLEKRKNNPEWRKKRNQKRYLSRKADLEWRANQNKQKDEKRKKEIVAKETKKQLDKSRYQRQITNEDYDTKAKEYERLMKRGHDKVCVCCGQLFSDIGIARSSSRAAETIRTNEDLVIVHQVVRVEALQLCHTCNNAVKRGIIPKLCLANGLAFPTIPEELQGMTQLEQRLVSPRIPFMQLVELRPTTQLGMKGNIVNVPIDLEQSVDILPREFDKTSTIQLAFKRRLQYKSSFLKEWIRPAKVYAAAMYLVDQQLYKDEGIVLSLEFLQRHQLEIEEFIVNDDDKEEMTIEDIDLIKQQDHQSVDHNDDGNWEEMAEEKDIVNPDDEQTLLKEVISFAPGEGHTPMSILSDQFVEELSFPAIYCGQKRSLKIKLSYTEIVKSEVRRFDRRCCDPVKLFFMFRKKEMLALNSAIQIYLRMTSQNDITVEQALNDKFIDELVRNDDAYRVLSNDRTSPVYWSLKKRELMAMIRTLGIPTFFLTLSAAETRWPELIVILVRVLENREITEEETELMTWQMKCNLIRKDPVTCARYFDRRVRELFKLMRTIGGPFQEYVFEDFYMRIEFQHRGSPHVHSLIWLRDSPKYSKAIPESKVLCEEFIDRFITCRKEREDLNLYYGLQTHKHTTSCKRLLQDQTICRFGVPFFPMPKTVILEPIEESSLSEEELESIPNILENIQTSLSTISSRVVKNNKDIPSTEEFLLNLGISYETYENAIRSTLKRGKIFLRRSPTDIRINAFNEEILLRHRANMDIQFVLDPYACVHYILDYINKSNRGMSRLLKKVVEEQKGGNMSHQQKLYGIASKFINSSEVSAQEAVYILLSMPLSNSSRASIFINTGKKEERVRRVRSKKELTELNPESSEILMEGLLEHYTQRPDDFEDMCLADFASQFDYSKKKKETKRLQDEENNPIMESEDDGNVYRLKSGNGFIRCRKHAKIIRYRRYQREKEPMDYYREKIMLFIPWRNEESELINIDHQTVYEIRSNQILTKEREFIKDAEKDISEVESDLETEAKHFFENPDEGSVPDEFAHLSLRQSERNFDEEIRDTQTSTSASGTFLLPRQLTDRSFGAIIAKLNEEQRHFVLGLLHLVKTSDEQFRIFLTGSAGTGKSVTIEAAYHTLIRCYGKHADCSSHPDLPTVILVGPTGKSAFHIGGTTLHSAFGLPVTKNKKDLKPMSADLKNKFRTKLWNLRAIIIDEVSMVGSGTLQNVHKRLVEIFENDRPFAGRSVLFVGDLNQLRPVMDGYVFQPPLGNDTSVIAGPILWRGVQYFRLNTIMRQRDDLKFAEALTRLANGSLIDEDRTLFESRLFPKKSLLLPSSAVRLFSQNTLVNRYNQEVIKRVEGMPVFNVQAYDICNHSMKRVRDQALHIVGNLGVKDTQGLPKSLDLKVSVRYMVSINIDIEDGLVNGSDGLMRKIDTKESDGRLIVERVWIEFDSPRVGFKARSLLAKSFNGTAELTPITRVLRDIKTKPGASLVNVSRCQFPLLIAEAITIHKSQGQSYEQVVVDVSTRADLQLLYTAMSRARTLNGLFLVGKELRYPPPRSANHPVSRELNRLESEAYWSIPLPLVSAIKSRGQYMVIGYQNLPLLSKHRDVVAMDHNLAMCDLLCFVETHSQGVKIEGFQAIFDFAPSNISYGMSSYSRNPLLIGCIRRMESIPFGQNAHLEYCWVSFQLGFDIVVLYNSPKVPKAKAIDKIKNLVQSFVSAGTPRTPCLLFGDFNINFGSKEGLRLDRELDSVGMRQLSPPSQHSTDYKTQIDQVYGYNIEVETAYYESSISDHKPLIIALKANIQ